MKDDGVEFVILRVGYRGWGTGKLVLDPKFAEYVKGAESVGIPIGVYFFTQAITNAEARAEANFTLRALRDAGLAPKNLAYPVAYDIEDSEGGKKARTYGMSKSKNTGFCVAFCDVIKNAGYKTSIYASKAWLLNKLDTKKLDTKYGIWLAHWTDKTDYTGAYQMWQYTSKGRVSGISGNVDMNIALNTRKTFPIDPGPFTVSFNSHGGSAIPALRNIEYGALIKKPVNPVRKHYVFAGWFIDKNYTRKWDFKKENVIARTTLHAKWRAVKYPLRYNDGKQTLRTVNVGYNTAPAKIFKPPAKRGKTFVGWFSDRKFTKAINLKKALKGPVTVYARYVNSPKPVNKLKASRVGMGKIRVSWKAVRGYVHSLEMSVKRNSGFSVIRTTRSGSFTVSRLRSGTIYYFRLRRYKRTVNKVRVFSEYRIVKARA